MKKYNFDGSLVNFAFHNTFLITEKEFKLMKTFDVIKYKEEEQL